MTREELAELVTDVLCSKLGVPADQREWVRQTVLNGVIVAMNEGVSVGEKAERERCARVAETHFDVYGVAHTVAALIREGQP